MNMFRKKGAFAASANDDDDDDDDLGGGGGGGGNRNANGDGFADFGNQHAASDTLQQAMPSFRNSKRNKDGTTPLSSSSPQDGGGGGGSGGMARPSYRSLYKTDHDVVEDPTVFDDDDDHHHRHLDDDDDDDEALATAAAAAPAAAFAVVSKAQHIEKSAGTHRLNRILSKSSSNAHANAMLDTSGDFHHVASETTPPARVDARDLEQVMDYCAVTVLPPFLAYGGGDMIPGSSANASPVLQEVLTISPVQSFEATGDVVQATALQFPADYNAHKRKLGLYTNVNVMTTTATSSSTRIQKQRLKYVLLARSTNRPLLERTAQQAAAAAAHAQASPEQQKKPARLDDADNTELNNNNYDTMFADDDMSHSVSLETSLSADEESVAAAGTNTKPTTLATTTPGSKHISDAAVAGGDRADQNEPAAATTAAAAAAAADEISSFPVLVCVNMHGDGSNVDIRKLVALDTLSTLQDLSAAVVQLAFVNGDTVRLDFGSGSSGSGSNNDHTTAAAAAAAVLEKERFIWSLLQVHAMLCTAVVERHSSTVKNKFLPPLNVRNVDRAELQYIATVNGFLRDAPELCVLLDRQMEHCPPDENHAGDEHKLDDDALEGLAYDFIMGKVTTRLSLFTSDEEKQDAQDILNKPEWTASLSSTETTAAVSVAERLSYMLQERMRDLEAETCRRLIAWEDEKHLSGSGFKLHASTDQRDTVDALALASLFKTLESLDTELQDMEAWLQDRAAAIKPLTDDCADIEEENRQLEQQWKSYDMLGAEMQRLLQGLDLSEELEKCLKNPASALTYDNDGAIDDDESSAGVEQIYEAGKALQEAIEFPRRCGGLHLQAVSERAEGLSLIANSFCKSLAQIIVTVMEQFKSEVVAGSDHGKVSKSDTHSMIAKKIRDTQRKFQSMLLGWIKLIEILAALSPEMLPALRDAYSEMVAEGILMKKRCKGYFQALPGKNAAYMYKAGKDIKDYIPFDDTMREEIKVNVPDVRAALSELFPVIAREAYFTSALFGSNMREQDGREKKRNFENARKAVDGASQNFRYYIFRTCGIHGGDDALSSTSAEAGDRGDPLLCVVSSICLNETMDNYIDREKKGGDHSLSLAYVRATILDLRKKADKQWVVWVERQIEWIKSSDGVPLTGKRAGVFPSFARFPCYLDHMLSCCREGRETDYMPDIAGIKVINYYLQKMASALLDSLKECAGRESTDQQYAANVMMMENSYFFAQSLKHRGALFTELFAKQITKANAMCKDSTDSYLGWMIKREFTALHELFSKVSKIRKEQGDKEVIAQVPKLQFVRILTKEASRDVLKEKIGSMFTRMEKHLSEEGGLLPVAWKALVKVLYEWFCRWEKLCTTIYRHKLDPSAVDVVRIAKAAGGAATNKTPNKSRNDSSSEFGFKSILALGGQNQK